MTTLAILPTADCGHTYTPPGPEGGFVGYAVDSITGKTRCPDCSNKATLADFLSDKAEPFTAYISSDGKAVTTWLGFTLAPVVESHKIELPRWSPTHGRSMLFVRVKDSRGRLWSGRGNPGMCVNLRRMKTKT